MLQAEFDRGAGNHCYSLRVRRSLSIDHRRCRVLRGRRRLTGRNVRTLGRRLRLTAPAIAEHCAAENESAVLAALARPGFRPDSRWLASIAGIPLDEVNVTIQRLLRKRMVTMTSRERWLRVEEA